MPYAVAVAKMTCAHLGSVARTGENNWRTRESMTVDKPLIRSRDSSISLNAVDFRLTADCGGFVQKYAQGEVS